MSGQSTMRPCGASGRGRGRQSRVNVRPAMRGMPCDGAMPASLVNRRRVRRERVTRVDQPGQRARSASATAAASPASSATSAAAGDGSDGRGTPPCRRSCPRSWGIRSCSRDRRGRGRAHHGPRSSASHPGPGRPRSSPGADGRARASSVAHRAWRGSWGTSGPCPASRRSGPRRCSAPRPSGSRRRQR